jgi:hypothetical protein
LAIILLIALVALTASSQENSSKESSTENKFVPPASCPVTPPPPTAFIPPAPYQAELPENAIWMGTEKLWTDIGDPMVWTWRPHEPGHEQDLTAKVFWFRVGYDYHAEPVPKLEVTGKRLDESAPPLQTPRQGDQCHLGRRDVINVDRCLCTYFWLLGNHWRLPRG